MTPCLTPCRPRPCPRPTLCPGTRIHRHARAAEESGPRSRPRSRHCSTQTWDKTRRGLTVNPDREEAATGQNDLTFQKCWKPSGHILCERSTKAHITYSFLHICHHSFGHNGLVLSLPEHCPAQLPVMILQGAGVCSNLLYASTYSAHGRDNK